MNAERLQNISYVGNAPPRIRSWTWHSMAAKSAFFDWLVQATTPSDTIPQFSGFILVAGYIFLLSESSFLASMSNQHRQDFRGSSWRRHQVPSSIGWRSISNESSSVLVRQGTDVSENYYPNASTHISVPHYKLLLATMALAPLLLLLFNSNWFFTPAPWVDAYYFQGYFLQYDNSDFAPLNYKISRLPWILLGYGLNRVASPVVAAYLLHAICLTISTGCMFYAVLLLFGSVGLAAFTALSLGFFVNFHGLAAAGWEYHNLPGGALLLVLLVLVIRVAHTWRNRRAYVALGVTGTLGVLTDPLLVNLVPVLAIYAVGLRRIYHPSARLWPDRRAAIFWMLAGAVGTLVFLGAINYSVGRGFDFLRPQLEFIGKRLGHNPNHLPFSWEWLAMSTHLGMPAAIALTGIGVLVFRKRDVKRSPSRSAARLTIAAYIASILVWTVWQFLGQEALIPEYFFYAVLPLCFLALAGILHHGARDRPAAGWLIALVVVAAFITPLCLIDLSSWIKEGLSHVAASPFVQVLLVTVLGLAVYFVGGGSTLTLSALALLMGLANAMSPWRPHYAYGAACKLNRDTFAAIASATQAIKELSPAPDRRRIWFQAGETFAPVPNCLIRLEQVGESIAAASGPYFAPRFYTEQRLTGEYFAPNTLSRVAPSLPEAVPEKLIEQAKQFRLRIIAVTRGETDVVRLKKRFETSGVSLDLLARRVVSAGQISFDLFVLQVAALRQPAGTFLRSCKEVRVRDQYVLAMCKRDPTLLERAWRRLGNWRNGFARTTDAPQHWVRTSLDFSACLGDIGNVNGVLACDAGFGTVSVEGSVP
jgi:hypothetical protein